ncbi:MAG: PLP-dependent aspartate aminotransferase family protein [Planctomycetota bacterium]|nr:PLP-dependent aspartate aminotransferase family protein [Planctomycetota bacterium]
MSRKNQEQNEQGFTTRAIHSGNEWNQTRGLTPPIFQTSTFTLENLEEGVKMGQAVAPPEFYTRWGNPTTKQFEAVMAELEGSEAALALSSGMGAISALILSLLQAGDHLLVGRSIYSGVHELANGILPRFGVESSAVDASDLDALAAAITPQTKALIVESPTNPTLEICDLAKVAALCREKQVISIIDNTFATPVNQNPIALGFDAVVHAATKAIGGHSDVTAGVICSTKEIIAGCWGFLKILGASLSPFEAWLLLRGLKTLELRVLQQNASALELARFLESRQDMEKVNYPGLQSHEAHELASAQMSGFGGMLSFELSGGVERGMRFADQLAVIQPAVSLGGAESILQHPASMSHGALGEAELEKAGIAGGLFRLSVGLENTSDLQADLEQALDGSATA